MDIKIEEANTSKANMRVVGTYVNTDTYKLLKAEANEKFLTVSSLIKKIIYDYLKSKNN